MYEDAPSERGFSCALIDRNSRRLHRLNAASSDIIANQLKLLPQGLRHPCGLAGGLEVRPAFEADGLLDLIVLDGVRLAIDSATVDVGRAGGGEFESDLFRV